MTLLEKLNSELEKLNLKFVSEKELNGKFKGLLVDTKQAIQMEFEVDKSLQFNMINSFSNFCRKHMDMYLKLVHIKYIVQE